MDLTLPPLQQNPTPPPPPAANTISPTHTHPQTQLPSAFPCSNPTIQQPHGTPNHTAALIRRDICSSHLLPLVDENCVEGTISSRHALEQAIYELIFCYPSKQKLPGQVFTLLFDIGLSIREAHLFSTIDGYFLQIFLVYGWTDKDSETLYVELENAIAESEFFPSQGQEMHEGEEDNEEEMEGKMREEMEKVDKRKRNVEEEVEELISKRKKFSEMIAFAVPKVSCCPICEKQMVDSTCKSSMCPVTREILLEGSGFTEPAIRIMLLAWKDSPKDLEAESRIVGSILTKEELDRLDRLTVEKLSGGMSWTRALAELTTDVASCKYIISYSLKINLWLLHILLATDDADVQEEIFTVFSNWTWECANTEMLSTHLFIAPWAIMMLRRATVAERVKVKCAMVIGNLCRYKTDSISKMGVLGALECLVELLENSWKISGMFSRESIEVVIRSICYACFVPENQERVVNANFVNVALGLVCIGIGVKESVNTLFRMRNNKSAMYDVQNFGKIEVLLDEVKIADGITLRSNKRDSGIYSEFKRILYHAYRKIFEIACEMG